MIILMLLLMRSPLSPLSPFLSGIPTRTSKSLNPDGQAIKSKHEGKQKGKQKGKHLVFTP